MGPTSFQFTVTMPGDSRLVTTVRELAAQAAAYAKMSAEAGQLFAQQVAAETESTFAATGVQDAPVEFRFDGDAQAVCVTISWSRNGTREARQIHQPLSS